MIHQLQKLKCCSHYILIYRPQVSHSHHIHRSQVSHSHHIHRSQVTHSHHIHRPQSSQGAHEAEHSGCHEYCNSGLWTCNHFPSTAGFGVTPSLIPLQFSMGHSQKINFDRDL